MPAAGTSRNARRAMIGRTERRSRLPRWFGEVDTVGRVDEAGVGVERTEIGVAFKRMRALPYVGAVTPYAWSDIAGDRTQQVMGERRALTTPGITARPAVWGMVFGRGWFADTLHVIGMLPPGEFLCQPRGAFWWGLVDSGGVS